MLLFALLAAALGSAEKNGVRLELFLEDVHDGRAVLRGDFTPGPRLHLYDKDLPKTAEAGRPTLLQAEGRLRAAGPLTASVAPVAFDGLSVYPAGPVTLRLPVALPTSRDARPLTATVLATWMACTETTCLVPVDRLPIRVEVPSIAGPDLPEDAAPASAAAAALEPSAGWRVPRTRAELDRMLGDSLAAGQPVLLDFTGPSCVNCQRMEKTVFREAAVTQAFTGLARLKINTDPPHEDLAAYEQEVFGTQARPLYVRYLGNGDADPRWTEVFSPSDAGALHRFTAFLRGGKGSSPAAGAGMEFWLLAVLGGLVTLLMPCTYPMIPFTLNVFTRQAESGRSVLPLAACYALGIVGSFTGLAVVVTGLFGANLATLSGHPLTNLLVAALFIGLGLSLLGAIELRLPAFVRLSGARGGYLGALLMGLTFALTAFSCTAPFAGSVLAEAVRSGSWGSAIGGMAVYSAAIAVPFFLLALLPSGFRALPRSGEWMNELKIIGGIVEIAAALKFLVICDVAWDWGFIGRRVTLLLWCAAALGATLYLARAWRTRSVVRVASVLAFAALAAYFAYGTFGHDLGLIEAFFPGDA